MTLYSDVSRLILHLTARCLSVEAGREYLPF